MGFDPTVLDVEAARYERLAADLGGVGRSYTSRIEGLDWRGERATNFARRCAGRETDIVSGVEQLRDVAQAVRDLAAGARAAIARLKAIAAAVIGFFDSLLAAAETVGRAAVNAAANAAEGLFKVVTFQPNDAAKEFGQAVDDVMSVLPFGRDDLPDQDDDPRWFDVDRQLAGCGDHGVHYQALGRPAEAA